MTVHFYIMDAAALYYVGDLSDHDASVFMRI